MIIDDEVYSLYDSTDTVRVQNPTDHTKILNELFSAQMEIEREYYLTVGKMREIDTIIDLIPNCCVREIARKKFISDVSWTELSKESNCDRGTIVYRIKKELSKII